MDISMSAFPSNKKNVQKDEFSTFLLTVITGENVRQKRKRGAPPTTLPFFSAIITGVIIKCGKLWSSSFDFG